MTVRRSIFSVGVLFLAGVFAPGGGTSALENSPSYPDQSQVFITSDCSYMLYLWLQPAEGATGNVPYIDALPGKNIRLGVSAGRVTEWYLDGGSLKSRPVTSCTVGASEHSFSGSFSDVVSLDLDGDGTFESSTAPGRASDLHTIVAPNKSNHSYVISAQWVTPRGETLTGSITVFLDVDCGVSINDGAEYTNSRDVTLTINPCPGATSVRVSNDGGFKKRTTVSPGITLDWNIPATRPGSYTRVVYIQYRGGRGGRMSDDIILDTTKPSLSSVSVSSGGGAASLAAITPRRVTIKTKAKDTISGVKYIQITNDINQPGNLIRYKSSVKFTTNDSVIYVRVVDKAGNVSAWKTATVR